MGLGMARGAGPAKKKSLDTEGGDGGPQWDWDKTSTPLAAKGKEPKYVKPADKVSATEGDNAFFFLDIVGDPIPTVTWFKCSKDLATEPRCKSWTKGPGQIILGFQKVNMGWWSTHSACMLRWQVAWTSGLCL